MDVISYIIGRQSGKTPLQEKTVDITANGTVIVLPDDKYALSKVTVNTNVASDGIPGFHEVRFFNDDRTTLLYTVYVLSGSSAIYAGETPVSTVNSGYIFGGFEPAATNVTADMDCYAVYAPISSLNEATWEQISQFSANGTAQNYFAVGDTKTIHVEGTVGRLSVNADYNVYILGFNHNAELEGNGVTFGTFKTLDGIDVCLVDSKYAEYTNDDAYYITGNGYTIAGWKQNFLRYNILGSVDVDGAENAGNTTATSPKQYTLMAALPTDLRAIMKPMTIYSDNTGDTGDVVGTISATIDYLPLLAEFEIFGKRTYAKDDEQFKQKRYEYFMNGNSAAKNKANSLGTNATYWLRSIFRAGATYCTAAGSGFASYASAALYSYGIAPIFRV